MTNETFPTDPETGEILGEIDGETTDGGPGVKPPIKRSAPRDDDATTDGGPGTKPPPKVN